MRALHVPLNKGSSASGVHDQALPDGEFLRNDRSMQLHRPRRPFLYTVVAYIAAKTADAIYASSVEDWWKALRARLPADWAQSVIGVDGFWYGAGLVLFVWGASEIFGWRRGAQPASAAKVPLPPRPQRPELLPAGEEPIWAPNSQAALIESLRRLRGDDPHPFTLHVAFASNAQRPLAERLRAIFEAAGWTLNFTNVPLDQYHHGYVHGIEVKGYNDYYTQAVADSLKASGMEDVRMTVAPHDIKSTSPKYVHTVRNVYITLGHKHAPILAAPTPTANPALLDALRVLIISRFSLVMERYLAIVFTMFQSCKDKDMARTCEDLLDQGLRHRFYNLRLDAERSGVDAEALASHLREVLKLYGEARFYIHRFQRLCGVHPMPEQIKLWLEADRECLVALRDLRARGLSKAVEKIDDGVMASTRSSDWLN